MCDGTRTDGGSAGSKGGSWAKEPIVCDTLFRSVAAPRWEWVSFCGAKGCIVDIWCVVCLVVVVINFVVDHCVCFCLLKNNNNIKFDRSRWWLVGCCLVCSIVAIAVLIAVLTALCLSLLCRRSVNWNSWRRVGRRLDSRMILLVPRPL